MPKKSMQEMAEQLLGGLVDDDNEEHNLLGYSEQRKTYKTPDGVPGEYVVRVESDSTESYRPSPVEEGLGNLRSGYLSAKSILEKQDPLPTEKLKQLESYYQSKCQALENITSGERIFANLTEKEDEKAESGPQRDAYTQNQNFRARLEKVNEEVGDFFVHAATFAGVKVKDLEKEGHRLRSKGRPTLVHEFKDPNEPDSGNTKFVIYIPAGRLTDRQMKLRALQGITDESRAHSTTSHHKKGFVHGNSSFVRMVVGTKSADGKVTITHDSFSGPGARMPYKDLKHGILFDGAKEKQNNMAVKAITFMNQEEIIQSVAQRIYDKKLAGKGVGELTQLFEKEGKTPPAFTGDREADRKALIDAYFKQTDLVEAYTQVISPTQAKIPFADGSDANREQFEYVRDAIRAFSGATDLKLNIDDGSEAGLTVQPQSYKGNHSAFGVNAFRQFNSIESEQNTRFINSMIDETFASIDASKLPDDVRVKYDALQQAMLGGDTAKVEALQAQVKDVEAELVDLNKQYRTAMMVYAEVYQKYQNVKNDPEADPSALKLAKKMVEVQFEESFL
jgi:inhibitor of growth protein SidF